MSQNLHELASPYKTAENAEHALALQRIVRNSFGILDGAFRDVRPDIHLIRPPVLMVDGQELSAYTAETFAKSPYTASEQGDIVFEASAGVVYASRQRVETLLSKGKEGEFRLTEILLEEFAHAYTTFPGRKDETRPIRVGLMKLWYPRRWHGLTPGYTYAFDIAKAQKPDAQESAYPPGPSLHVTENLTRIVVTCLLYEYMVKPRFPEYNFVRLVKQAGEGAPYPAIGSFVISRRIWQAARTALLEGNDGAIRGYYPKMLTDLLPEKNVIVCLTKAVMKGQDDVFGADIFARA